MAGGQQHGSPQADGDTRGSKQASEATEAHESAHSLHAFMHAQILVGILGDFDPPIHTRAFAMINGQPMASVTRASILPRTFAIIREAQCA